MTHTLTLDLGPTTDDKERRRLALQQLAALVGAYGRNNVPSASELARRIADAYEFAPEATAGLMQEVIRLASAAYAADGETVGN